MYHQQKKNPRSRTSRCHVTRALYQSRDARRARPIAWHAESSTNRVTRGSSTNRAPDAILLCSRRQDNRRRPAIGD